MRDRLFVASAQVLGAAFLIALGFAAISILLPDGREAVLTIGGVYHPDQMPQAQKLAFLVDSAFLIFYGAGLICLTAALSQRAVRPLSRVLILAILILVICDIAENHLIMNGFASADGRAAVTSIVTGVKYSLVGLVAIGLSVIIPPDTGFHKLLALVLRIFFPLLIAAHVVIGGDGTIAGDIVSGLTSLSFLLLLASLSWISWQAREVSSEQTKEIVETPTPVLEETMPETVEELVQITEAEPSSEIAVVVAELGSVEPVATTTEMTEVADIMQPKKTAKKKKKSIKKNSKK